MQRSLHRFYAHAHSWTGINAKSSSHTKVLLLAIHAKISSQGDISCSHLLVDMTSCKDLFTRRHFMLTAVGGQEFMQRSLHTQALTQRSLQKQEFKLKTHLARHLATAHGLSIQPGSPRPVMKTRAAFCLITTPLTRISRKICKDILRPRHAARCCFIPINTASIKQECERGFHTDVLGLSSNCGIGPHFCWDELQDVGLFVMRPKVR